MEPTFVLLALLGVGFLTLSGIAIITLNRIETILQKLYDRGSIL